MQDRTNYFQSVLHVLKANMGTGILAMPLSVQHLGYVSAVLVLPAICLICGYCVHVLVQCSRRVSKRSNAAELNYSQLAVRAFQLGPERAAPAAGLMGRLVDTALLMTQIGACCVYVIFVVDNVTSILATYHVYVSQMAMFLAVFPVALALSCIRTLNRLAIASFVANLLQVVGLAFIIEYLVRDAQHFSLKERRAFSPTNEMALGFGSVMFAFEGISVVIPVYNRIKRREQMASLLGVVNVSFLSILVLYFVVGFLGFLRFGPDVRDSITLNLPAAPLYDAVRAMFTLSILLTYPLQLYVPNEIIWKWLKGRIARGRLSARRTHSLDTDADSAATIKALDIVIAHGKPGLEAATRQSSCAAPVAPSEAARLAAIKRPASFAGLNTGLEKAASAEPPAPPIGLAHTDSTMSIGSKAELVSDTTSSSGASWDSPHGAADELPLKYEYLCRTMLVTLTFALAISVPRLNLVMGLIGSFSGTLLCLTLPAAIHLVTYWEKLKGFKKCLMIVTDLAIVLLSLAAGLGGSYSSLIAIISH